MRTVREWNFVLSFEAVDWRKEEEAVCRPMAGVSLLICDPTLSASYDSRYSR